MHPSTNEEIDQGVHAIKTIFATHALLGNYAIDARSLTILHHNNNLRNFQLPEVDPSVISVLSNIDHLDHQLCASLGPLVIIQGNDDKPGSIATCITDLVLHPDMQVRKAALDYFESLSRADPPLLTPASISAIAHSSGPLMSSDHVVWEEEALALNSKLSSDILLNIAAIKQCHELRWGDGILSYLKKVLHPKIESVQQLPIGITMASEQQAEIKELIAKCSTEPSIAASCAAYYNELGHLPLTKNCGLGWIISEWLKQNTVEDAWSEVWSWAQQSPSPLRRYHATSIFLFRPDLIPSDKTSLFWCNIAEIVDPSGKETQPTEWAQAWALRYDLARYYEYYLECHLPGSNGETIASHAWWLAEKVALVFGADSEAINFVRKSLVDSELKAGSFLWPLTHPKIVNSNLRYATLSPHNVWSLSLQCQMADALAKTTVGMIEHGIQDRLSNALQLGLLLSLPTSGNPIYALDDSVVSSARSLVTIADSDSIEPLALLIEHYPNMTSLDLLGTSLKQIHKEQKSEQMLLCHRIRCLAFSGTAPLDIIWTCLSDDLWQKDVWLTLDLELVELLSGALAEIASQHGGKWSFGLPHIYAVACESCVNDPNRQDLFLALCVASSVANGTVSGIERLVRGNVQHQIGVITAKWRRILEQLLPQCAPWVAGRIRAVLASMYISE